MKRRFPIRPFLVLAALVAPAAPSPAADCDPDPDPGPPFPSNPQATLKVGGRAAAPGTEVLLPVVIQANSELQGFSISVDFDESVLEGIGTEKLYSRPDGEDWDFYVSKVVNENSVPDPRTLLVNQGFLVGAGVFSLHNTASLLPPRETDTPFLGLRFRVKPDAPAGTTEIRFVDGFRGEGEPIANIVTLANRSVIAGFDVSPLTIGGQLQIVGDLSLFVRGNSNGQGKVDLSDVTTTLGFLYLGDAPPYCLDAADANDDGRVNIADPVTTLDFLFLGGPSLPPPNLTPGDDPTQDGLACIEEGL